MPETMNVLVATMEPYVSSPITRVTNQADTLYNTVDGASSELTVTQLTRGKGPSREHGLLATIAFGVNPDAVPGS